MTDPNVNLESELGGLREKVHVKLTLTPAKGIIKLAEYGECIELGSCEVEMIYRSLCKILIKASRYKYREALILCSLIMLQDGVVVIWELNHNSVIHRFLLKIDQSNTLPFENRKLNRRIHTQRLGHNSFPYP